MSSEDRGEPSSIKPIRTSQREIKSCGFCYRRKIKCDKTYPCSKCVARGLGDLCEQEMVIVNGRLRGGGPDGVSRKPRTLAELGEENKTLQRKIATQEGAIRSLLSQLDEKTRAEREAKATPATLAIAPSALADLNSRASSMSPDPQPVDAGDRADYLAEVGKVFGLSADQDLPSGQQPVLLFTQASGQALASLRGLVPIRYSAALVQYHCNFLHWIHAVFHVPTFLEQHDTWLAGGQIEVSYDFYALYFAVIACSLYFMDEAMAVEMGLPPNAIEVLPRFWFDTSLNCIQLAGYMINPTLPILQAICILPTIAHAFDRSRYLASLMHCALGLARDLNYHLVRAESSADQWGGNIRSQLIRRIWWCLMIADSFTPNAQHPYHLIYPGAWTSPPANVDDADLSDELPIVPRPLDDITCVSQVVMMGRLASLFRDFCHTFTSKPSINSRFRLVKDFDQRLDHLLDDTPQLRPVADESIFPQYPINGRFDWTPWARFVWATTIPAMRIQLWRWHLSRSYTDPRFAEAREVCIGAARQMLATRLKPVPIMFQKNWHVSSHTVMCGMVLAVEMTHGAPDSTTRQRLRSDVLETLGVLQSTANPNAMVKRGIQILEKMLSDADQAAAALAEFSWPGGDFDLDVFDMILNSDAYV